MKDMITLTRHDNGERVGIRVSQVAVVFDPKYAYRDGTVLRMVDKSEIEVRESYDQVWRMMDEASRPDQIEGVSNERE